MSWIQKLYETYEQCQGKIGEGTDEYSIPLLPICHTTQKAQIEIAIDEKGNFKRARVIPKTESRTIIPCTEKSAGRAGIKPECHPLCDKLQYIARDFVERGGIVTKGFAKRPLQPHEDYLQLLTAWCCSPYGHPKAQAVLAYVMKGHVISDLITHKVLIAEKGKLLSSWEKTKEQEMPEIFTVLNNSQDEAFIRWVVEAPDVLESKAWKDRTLWESWIKFYTTTKNERALCYVTGKEELIADQHPAKLRNDADKAKIISSNDQSGFTFRGRALTADQACTVGFETSQKAHYTLRWLIGRQGYRHGDHAVVAWATNGAAIPQPLDDAFMLLGFNELQPETIPEVSTSQEFALRLRDKIRGYGVSLGPSTGIVVLSLESATPGRMSMTFYRELDGSEFLQRVEAWHQSCRWVHRYRSSTIIDSLGKAKTIHIPFIGAPSLGAIAEAVYGERVDDKLKMATIERLLPCIIDGRALPRDIVESAVRRASNRLGKESWEWNKSLSIACALYRKYHIKEEYDMALDTQRQTRDYLYGRLLAIAERIEEAALYKAKEKRETNAARYMQQFAEHPNKTWRQIYLSLSPYLARLGGGAFFKSMIDDVMCLFATVEDFSSDKALTGEYLIGYHCQRSYFWKKETEELINTEITETTTTN